jgi:predicted ArsR family transcriptional regulator
MANANVVTKQDRVLEALRNNDKGLTAAQIENQFKVGNARATVSSLRMKGFAIFANQHTDTKGRSKTFYRLGTPPRSVVAAGYRALAAQAV